MAKSNTVLRIAELDFDGIKNNLKQFLRSQSQFSDFDFEGSGMNILLDVLAYNTHYMSYYLNMIGNEMFLDSATLRNSVVSHAKHLNYFPSSSRGSTATVRVVANDTPSTQSTLTLPAYTQFFSESIDGVNYKFINLESYKTTKNVITNEFTFPEVVISQGEIVNYNVIVSADNTTRRFLIPSANIDTTTLTISVRQSSESTEKEVFVLSNDITTIDGNSRIYFLEEDPSGGYALYFGDGYIGKGLSNGNIVEMKYLDTNGQGSNRANGFTLITSVGSPPISNVVVIPVTASAGGAAKESIESIKFTAPKFYTTQNRAVTVNDYSTILQKDYPNIQAASIWGGEDNDPPIYGKVFISFIPKFGYVVTELEKTRIINEIIANRNMLTIIPEIVEPEYVYLRVLTNVYYDPSRTTLDENQLKDIVKQAINDYDQQELEVFNATLRASKLQNLIDTSNDAIDNSDLTITLQKRFKPTPNVSKNYTLDFNTPLKRETFKNKLYSYPGFTITDQRGVDREVFIEEVPLSYTGITSIDVENGGTGYVIEPDVVIRGDGTGATARAKIVNGRVVTIQVISQGSNYTTATVEISGGGGRNATAKPVLSTEIGTLRSYYVQGVTGEKVVVNDNIGTINYTTGRVRLIAFNPTSISLNPNYSIGTLTINVVPALSTIKIIRNSVLTLDQYDPIALQVIMEKST